MKKVLSSIIIILILFNFIFYNAVFAAEGSKKESDSPFFGNATFSPTIEPNIIENGSDGKNGTGITSYGPSEVGVISALLMRLVDFCALQIDLLMSQISSTTVVGAADPANDKEKDLNFWFTIDRTVFNRVALFNINYFSTSDYDVGDSKITIVADKNNTEIKNSITTTYYICRILALLIGLLVLIYIGIRMAISTVASEQARYKKMLNSWIESIVILFVMPYIMSIIFLFGDTITGLFWDIRCSLLNKTVPGSSGGLYGVFEETVRLGVLHDILTTGGFALSLWSIVYYCLLFSEMKFFWTYAKRLLMVGFLIIISPLITITYSIDKAGDGKAQAFSIWLKEFLLNVLIQPLHALLYLIFIFSANAIAKQTPLVAVALLFSMGQAERMVKVIFNMKGSVTLRGVDKFLKKEG